jgi:hemerythrin
LGAVPRGLIEVTEDVVDLLVRASVMWLFDHFVENDRERER